MTVTVAGVIIGECVGGTFREAVGLPWSIELDRVQLEGLATMKELVAGLETRITGF